MSLPIKAGSKGELENLLEQYQERYDSVVNQDEPNERIARYNLIGVGKECSKLCYLIEKHIGNSSDELIDWLTRKSKVNFMVGYGINSYRQMELKYSSYSHSGDTDKKIAEILKKRGEEKKSFEFCESSIDKYRKSIHFARKIEDGEVFEKNLKKGVDAAIQSIGFSFNKIAKSYLLMYDLTKDDMFLEEAKLANDYSKHAFKRTNADCPGLNIVTKQISYRESKISA